MGDDMKFGGATFFTEYSMTARDLAVALEERGYDSIWAPEHSHIPHSRKHRSLAAANCPSNLPMRWTRSWS
jgi:alkanesulfonate monooxygenase SsuD/methylene tetrahydromethanopterin reductase-like flavin-dependent oxidoreductase (luciferase family)